MSTPPSNMGWPTGYVPSAAEWAESQSMKADYPVAVDQGGTGGQTVGEANRNLQQRVLIDASPFNAAVLTRYAVKTLSGAYTINLPKIGGTTGPRNGDWIDIADADNNAGVNHITVNGASGDNILYQGSVNPSQVIIDSGSYTTAVVENGQWNMISSLSSTSALSSTIPVQDNGTGVVVADTLNFTGPGVVVTDGGGGTANIYVPGSSLPPLFIADRTYTLALTDSGQYIQSTNALSVVVTVPAAADVDFRLGTVITFEQAGDGALSVAGAVGVTLNSRSGALAATGKYSVFQIKKVDVDTWTVIGDVSV